MGGIPNCFVGKKWWERAEKKEETENRPLAERTMNENQSGRRRGGCFE